MNTNYRLYMDRNGYVIGYIATEDVSKNYLVVLDSDMYMSTGEAKVMLADGTIETVKLKDTYKGKVGDVPTDAKNGGLERAVFSYTVDSKGVYTLGILDERTAKGETGVAFYYNGSTESVQDYDLPTHPADSFGDYTHYNDGTVLDIENETANMKDSSGAKILVDLKTVFVDAEDEVIYTGYDEVPSYVNPTPLWSMTTRTTWPTSSSSGTTSTSTTPTTPTSWSPTGPSTAPMTTTASTSCAMSMWTARPEDGAGRGRRR